MMRKRRAKNEIHLKENRKGLRPRMGEVRSTIFNIVTTIVVLTSIGCDIIIIIILFFNDRRFSDFQFSSY